MIVTAENYYSREANREYMSASQFKAFLDCEARAMAELAGEWQPEPTQAMLVGGYVDAYFSNESGLFRAEHPEIFKRDSTLKAEYLHAEDIIARIERDPLAMMMLDGKRQTILINEIHGVPFRGKLDVLLSAAQCAKIAEAFPDMGDLLFADGAIVDLKIMRDFEPIYRPEQGRMSFIEYWRYDLQMAVYRHLLGRYVPCYILAATKEKVPDIGLFLVPDHMLDTAYYYYMDSLTRIMSVKSGETEPERCEACDYCKQTKTLTCGALVGDWA